MTSLEADSSRSSPPETLMAVANSRTVLYLYRVGTTAILSLRLSRRGRRTR